MTFIPDFFSQEVERLQEKIRRLERRIRELEAQRAEDSWTTNPDRSGGAYTAQEISDTNTWR